MARPKGMGLQDDVPFTLRMTKERKKLLKQRSKAAGVSMALYGRCKLFDEPLPSDKKKERNKK